MNTQDDKNQNDDRPERLWYIFPVNPTTVVVGTPESTHPVKYIALPVTLQLVRDINMMVDMSLSIMDKLEHPESANLSSLKLKDTGAVLVGAVDFSADQRERLGKGTTDTAFVLTDEDYQEQVKPHELQSTRPEMTVTVTDTSLIDFSACLVENIQYYSSQRIEAVKAQNVMIKNHTLCFMPDAQPHPADGSLNHIMLNPKVLA